MNHVITESRSRIAGLMHRTRSYASHAYNCAYVWLTDLAYAVGRFL